MDLYHAEPVGELLVDEVIELSHLNFDQRLLLLLLLRVRGLNLFLWRRHLAIEHPEINAVRLFGQLPGLLQVVQNSDIGAPRDVLDRLTVRRIIHELIERLFHFVMFELLPLLRVVRNVAGDVRRRVEADRAVDFHKPNSPIQVEAEELAEHHSVSSGGRSRSASG